ncbi:MAG: exodeoxyribonuclease VII large subunit, partial [Candidatus Limnocylindria bacterium]
VDRGERALRARLERGGMALAALGDALSALSPRATLARGYAVARLADGTILRDAAHVAAGDPLHVTVARGTLDTRVERTRVDDAGRDA